MSWVVAQLGAREHYAIPRALAAHGCLDTLLTDSWVPPRHPWGWLGPRLAQRHAPGLESAQVLSWTWPSARFELGAKLRGLKGWELILARNHAFQHQALSRLNSLPGLREQGPPSTLFSYSYTAKRLFGRAKSLGWRTILGQIDAGPALQSIVSSLNLRHPAWVKSGLNAPPPEYWSEWAEECRLADRIIVNSPWVRDELAARGIPSSRLAVVPLAYEGAAAPLRGCRGYPSSFSTRRPLRALFVGQVTLLKGIAEIVETAKLLRHEPVVFTIVGPLHVRLPPEFQGLGNVHWVGPVARAQTAEYYGSSDVLLFPSHGDGFGLVQLEAQAWGLPIISSRNCGRVVEDGANGVLLSEVTPAALAGAITEMLREPGLLSQMSRQASLSREFSLSSVGKHLIASCE